MKQKRIWIIAVVCVVVVAVGLATGYFVRHVVGKKPFADLEASEIQRATVHLSPPDMTYVVPDLQKLTGYLQDLVIYEEDDSYTDYTGQVVIFTLSMADGTERTVMDYNPFLVVDGVGYRTEYGPCEALNHYGNQIAGGDAARPVLDAPPWLGVVTDEMWDNALRGGYSWTTYHDDGTAEATIADSAHPLDCQELLECLDTTEATARLEFQLPPTEITAVHCWSEDDFGNPSAESEPVEIDGQTINLLPGGHVYEVTARWEGEDYDGEASYSFWIDFQP